MRGIVGRHLVQATRPGERQASGRVGATGENPCRGGAALIARPPHLRHRLHLIEPGHGDGKTGIEHDDRIRIYGGDVADQLILFPWQPENLGPVAAPREHHGLLCLARRGDRSVAIGVSLLRSHPREAHLHRLACLLAGRGNGNLVCAGLQGEEGTHIVQTVRSWQNIVLVRVQHAASPRRPGAEHRLSVQVHRRGRAEHLEREHIGTVGRNRQRAGPAPRRSRSQCAAVRSREIQLARGAVDGERCRGNRRAGHVIRHGEPDPLASELFDSRHRSQLVRWNAWTLAAGESDGDRLPAPGPIKATDSNSFALSGRAPPSFFNNTAASSAVFCRMGALNS